MDQLVAIFSVISSAAVAIAVAVISGRQEQRRLREEAYGKRVDDLRTMLDDALTPVIRATMLLQFTMRVRAPQAFTSIEFISPVPTDFDPARALREADDLRVDVAAFRIRLAMRLGPTHTVLKSYDQALQCLRRASRILTRAENGDEAVTNWTRDVRTHLDEAYRAESALANAASELIGLNTR